MDEDVGLKDVDFFEWNLKHNFIESFNLKDEKKVLQSDINNASKIPFCMSKVQVLRLNPIDEGEIIRNPNDLWEYLK